MNGNIAKYLFKVWLTSGTLCPIILIFLLSVIPTYQVPDMIGFLLIVYIFPCTFLLSIINIVTLAVALSIASRNESKKKYIKLILTGVAVLTSYVTMLLVYHTHLFEAPGNSVDYILLFSYILAIGAGLFFFRLMNRNRLDIATN